VTEPHVRNIGPMKAAARCGAKTRGGTLCAAPAVVGNVRCRMHGGKGSGAPKGNQNALKHGHYTHEEKELRREMAELLRESRKLIEKF
jgi:hypothetical protein